MDYFISYNGVVIPMVIVNGNMVSEQSDDGVDKLYTHYTLNVQGHMNPGLTGVNNAIYRNTIAVALQEPRKYFKWYSTDPTNGLLIYLETPSNGDAKNGPIVSNVSISDINGIDWLINITFDIWLAPCEGSTPLISCRWSQSQSINEDQMSEIQTDGIAVFRRDVTPQPDAYRNLILPVRQIPKGFTRSQKFTVNSEGTKLMFSLTDTERYRMPVDKMSSWEGTWRELNTLENGGGVLTTSTLYAKATAPKDVSKKEIVKFLGKIVASRVNLTPGPSGQADIVLSSELVEELDKNTVAISVTVTNINGQNSAAAMTPTTTRIGTIVEPLDTSSAVFQPTNRGSANITLFIANVFPTCADKSGGSPPGNTTSEKATNYNYEVTKAYEIVETSTNSISEAQQSFPYTYYDIDAQYRTNYHTIGLPLASGASSGITQSVCKTAPPTTELFVKVHAERLGAMPNLPQVINDSDYFVKDVVFVPFEPQLLPNGQTFKYVMEAEYVFGLKTVVIPGTSTIKLPISPIPSSAAPNLIKVAGPSNFSQNAFPG